MILFVLFILCHVLDTSALVATAHHRLLVLGLGGIGRAIVKELSTSDYFEQIQGTSRSPTSFNDDVILFESNSVGAVLPKCTHVLITIPPPIEHDAMFDAVVKELASKLPPGAWLGFVSTSGVYGNHNGSWVTEDSPLYCSEKSLTFRYIEHEKKWQEISQESGWTCRVFRCAGLYGPDRSALHTLWKKCVLDISPAAGITNRIHETDVARAIVASMMDPSLQRDFCVYNLSDDEPEGRSVVMKYARELFESIGVDVAITESSEALPASVRATRRGTDIKRVSNDRMKRELVSELQYPTYREGLMAILKDASSPWKNQQ
jgi:hypothetical protein